jgi:hypothetical protein
MNRLLLAGLFCLSVAASAHADSIILTDGFYHASFMGDHQTNVSGPNFSLSTIGALGLFSGNVLCSVPCPATVPVNVQVISSDNLATVTYNGTTYMSPPLVVGNFVNGQALFQVPTGILGSITLTAPIVSFSGIASVSDVFSVDFTGSGFATAVFTISSTGNTTDVLVRDVRFNITSPVPEPSSIILLGLGLGGVITRRLRRSSR